ncbi:hypothetical protein [Sphingopyxis sp. GW247-27LB]|uniref:hypothetical protein n=1 Tax=Sphingopyxis sp. GW247-27LB TaxID=2012632 RepID=UPI000BA683DF|nr:hypothetical protein [Sphingopyxis sp. GW247-27LB]PAL20145.1 hypothetical protein CD928_17175 [Sphingopyxis sp. GW247-27LB]
MTGRHFSRVVFGNKKTALSLIRHLVRIDMAPDLVVTLGETARAGVDIAGGANDMAGVCRDLGIAVYECSNYRLSGADDQRFFTENGFDLAICTGWQRLIPQEILDRFASGVFGFHGSGMRFPNGRGRSPLNWTLRLSGDRVFHNCFRYAAGADDGALFQTTELPIAERDTIAILQFKALVDIKLSAERLFAAHAAGAIPLIDQPDGPSIWLPKLTPDDSRLQFASMPRDQLLGIIRASAPPFAGAFATLSSGDEPRRCVFRNAIAYDGPMGEHWTSAAPGTILDASSDFSVIACLGGPLLVIDSADSLEDKVGERLD